MEVLLKGNEKSVRLCDSWSYWGFELSEVNCSVI